MWFQKLREKWHLSGGKNTNFFHAMASFHAHHNYISHICRNMVSYSLPQDVKRVTKQFFFELFRKAEVPSFSLNNINFASLSDEECVSLTIPFSEKEIFEGL